MTKLRFLIDDTGQSRTQRAVLAAFARTLPESADVVWSSALEARSTWDDAPAESARRLALRLAALAPAADQLTVFLPGHIVPGELHGSAGAGRSIALPAFTTVAALDLFAAENASSLVAQFQQHCAAHPDYESCSGYVVGDLASVPAWLLAGGLTSAVVITQRPWYFARIASRRQWLAWVAKALQQNLLTLKDVEADAQEGLVRPSLVEDAAALIANADPLACPDTTLDALFIYPECKVSDAQYAMLHSQELQARTLLHAKLKAARKMALEAAKRPAWQRLSPPWQRIRKLGRKLYSIGFRCAYLCYAVSLRPLIRRSDRRAGRP